MRKTYLYCIVLTVLTFVHSSLWSGTRSSTDYSISADTVDFGGLVATSTDYSNEGSLEPGATSASVATSYWAQHGFVNFVAPYDLWTIWHFPGVSDPAVIGPSADSDFDFVTNLFEFGFGMDPNVSGSGSVVLQNGLELNATGLPVSYVASIPTGVDFRVVFATRTNFEDAGLTYTPQFSSDLTTWYDSPDTPVFLDSNGEIDLVSVPYPFWVGPLFENPRFFRVKIEFNP